MENLKNNSENTSQDSDFDSLSNMPSFEDMRKQNAVPEGVRDEQDYREYLAEKQARAAEQEKAGSEFAEHSKKYIAEIAKLEDSADKYMAIASLRHLTNERQNEHEKNDSINTQEVLLEFFNRDNKHETIKNFIDNKINDLRNSGASEETINHYDIPKAHADSLESIEENARIHALNQADEEECLDELNSFMEEDDSLSGLEFDEYKTSEKRPASDRGILLSMATELLKDNIHEENMNMHALNSTMIKHIAYYYNGQDFDRQSIPSNERFSEKMMHALKGDYKVSPLEFLDMLAINELKSNLNIKKHSYSGFCKILDKGQELLNNSL